MKRVNRRLVLAGCVLTIITTGSGVAAFASGGTPAGNVCLVTSQDPNHRNTQDLCVNW